MSNCEVHYCNNKDLKKENVQALMDWLQHQPHFPPLTEYQVIIFLHSCYYNNEAAKKTIDNYLTVRKFCPEFFANRNPSNPDIQTALDLLTISPLPKLTKEGYCIIYFRLVDTNTDKFVYNNLIKMFDMAASIALKELGTVNGHIIVIDLEGYSLTHIMKMGVMTVKKYMFFLQEALPFRLKGFHFANAVPFMDKLMLLMKPFMKKELLEMLQVHSGNNETLFEFVDKNCLPNEIGGSVGSVFEIHNAFRQKFFDYKNFFEEEEKLVVDESKRPGSPRNVGDIFGVEGTFKKMEID
ncbi:PREDICTED: alpha-tocopherol transfer protein-like [Nicrophorus vespilloides]|uniref:Alpha-tocopherol transfer protein-like n=1 Tax=Nicrophorus vespilloides TaxID=110193 RepID=A0ABM1N3N1_NICVS|nr:PREDICTED: alpha-tocopherol transfer protein-like [Nicrophorus vespilloides]XP_017781432.1 PREDICTED: alpha-tocopherol transfer protein-like [Nicrophorus vespilloides]